MSNWHNLKVGMSGRKTSPMPFCGLEGCKTALSAKLKYPLGMAYKAVPKMGNIPHARAKKHLKAACFWRAGELGALPLSLWSPGFKNARRRGQPLSCPAKVGNPKACVMTGRAGPKGQAVVGLSPACPKKRPERRSTWGRPPVGGSWPLGGIRRYLKAWK